MAAHGGSTDSQESLDISRHGNDSPPSSLPTLDKDYNLIGHLTNLAISGLIARADDKDAKVSSVNKNSQEVLPKESLEFY